MPRDNDKNNGRPPRRERGAGGGGKGRPPGAGSRDDRPARSAGPRSGGGGKSFGANKFGEKKFGEKRPFSDRPDRGPRKEFGARDGGDRPFKPREDRGAGARSGGDRPFKPREDRGAGARSGGDRPFKPREDRGAGARSGGDRPFKPREDRGAGARSGGDRPFKPREDRGAGARSGGDRPFKPREDRGAGARSGGDRPFKPRGEGFRKDGPRGDSPRPARFNRDDRPQRDDRPRFNRDERPNERPARSRGAPDRGPRKDFNERSNRSFESKPWEKRAPSRDDAGRGDSRRDDTRRDSRPPRDGAREERGAGERPRFARPRFDKPHGERGASRSAWQEHPRSEGRDERPRRDNEDDSKVFAKRPAFGGRGAFRDRKPDFDKRAPRPAAPEKKAGERIAKIVSRAGLCSRRDAEEWITQGRVAVNGRVINSPALDITVNDVVTIDGKKLPERERTRLFLYHKPRGLMTTHDDPEGRPTVFDNLPDGLPRLISVGRLDFNTEGLLLLTNDGGLARALELPDTGWLRRYRVRAHGEVTQAQLDELKKGVEVDGVKYGSIDATLERDKGANVWIVFAIREGKNREVRNVMAHLGLEVNRLIRVSYGPFQLGEVEEGQVEEIKSRVLREQLGDKIVSVAGAQFDRPTRQLAPGEEPPPKVHKPKRAVIADRKGRRVLVQRTGSDEARARNEEEASGFGPPRRPTRGYKGKRDITPKDE